MLLALSCARETAAKYLYRRLYFLLLELFHTNQNPGETADYKTEKRLSPDNP